MRGRGTVKEHLSWGVSEQAREAWQRLCCMVGKIQRKLTEKREMVLNKDSCPLSSADK